jgi:hypothetical protein
VPAPWEGRMPASEQPGLTWIPASSMGKLSWGGREIKTFNEKGVVEKIQADIGKLVEKLDFCGPGRPYPENLPPLW